MKKIYRVIETRLLRIRYNWKNIIKKGIISLIPIIPLIIFVLRLDQLNIFNDIIKTFTLEVVGYRIKLFNILMFVIIGSFILLIIKIIFRPISYEEYNDNMKNALTRKEDSGDEL